MICSGTTSVKAMKDESPKRSVVWPGSILGTIVNAIMTAENADFATSQQWDGKNYLLDGWDGRYGAVTFDEDSLVGVFFDAKSDRSPFRCGEDYDLERFFRGMPPSHRSLANLGALKYWHQWMGNKLIPCVTAVFWDEGEYLTASEPWELVLANGAELIRTQLLEDKQSALEAWRICYGMNSTQVDLAKSLFNRKMAAAKETIELTLTEIQLLEASSTTLKSMEYCRDLFARIGIQAILSA